MSLCLSHKLVHTFCQYFFWDEFLQPGEKKKEGAKGTKGFVFLKKK
jgi:hypothetical protein